MKSSEISLSTDSLIAMLEMKREQARVSRREPDTGLLRWVLTALAVSTLLAATIAGTADAGQGANRPLPADPIEGQQTDEFIVVYRDGVSLPTRLRAEVDLGIQPEAVFRNIFKGFAAELDPGDLKRLEEDPRVRLIEPDFEATISRNSPGNRAVDSWGLDRIDQRIGPLDGRLVTGDNGFGVEAYIIDTGIRLDHSEFTGRVNPEGFSSIEDGWRDCNGHGTHVAGTVAGSSYGVAPAARLTSVRVLNCEGSGSYSGVIDGIDWMVGDHATGEPAVGNMSLGGPRSDAINLAVRRAVDDGITMVVAAGNESMDACSKSPASAPEALTVGSLTRSDNLSDFSNSGPCVDLFAPGSEIKSAWYTSRTATETISGTSMASPHVAGAAALRLSRSPDLNPAQVTEWVTKSSTPGDRPLDPGCLKKRMLFVGTGPDIPETELPPPPSNDDFSDREPLDSLNPRTVTSTCATAETGEPGHGVPPYDYRPETSVWFEWTAPSSGLLVLEHQRGSFSSVVSVYSGDSLEHLTLEARNQRNDWMMGLNRVSTRVDAGVTYSIAIDGYSGTSGSVELHGSFVRGTGSLPGDSGPAPVNDSLASATSLGSGFEWDVDASNEGASAQRGEPNHATWYTGGPFGSVWYRWTAPASGRLTLRTNDYDVAAYTGSTIATLERTSPTEWGWGLPGGSDSMAVRKGLTYRFALETWPGFEYSSYFQGSLEEAPGNDDLRNATRIESWDDPVRANNEAATIEPGEPSHDDRDPFAPYASVWYEWTASGNGWLSLDASYSPINDPSVTVYTGPSVGQLVRVGGDSESVRVPVREGVTYRIAIDSSASDELGGINLHGGFIEAATNDDFADAASINLHKSYVTGSTFGSTLESEEPFISPLIPNSPVGSVWYRWTPRHNMKVTFSTSDEYWETVTAYTGESVETLTEVAGGEYSSLDLRASAGTTYSFAVQEDPTENISMRFRLRRQIEPPRVIAGPRWETLSRSARFRLRGEPGVTFECKLNSQPNWKKCGSTVTYRRLQPREHIFRVRARDGHSASFPTEFWWRVDRKRGK